MSSGSELSPPPASPSEFNTITPSDRDVQAESPRRRRRTATAATAVKIATIIAGRSSRKRKATIITADLNSDSDTTTRTKSTTTTTTTVTAVKKQTRTTIASTIATTTAPPTAKKARTKKAAALMLPLAARTLGSKHLLGAHVSAAAGVQNAITNSIAIGGNALAMFLKNQRKWRSPPMPAADAAAFRKAAETNGYDAKRCILPHGSYLVNLAQPNREKAMQAWSTFVDDMKRAEELGVRLYNFHPGSTLGGDRNEALTRIADALNRAHREKGTGDVMTVIENMAGAGNVIGCEFEDLRDIIAGVEDKARVGVCLDTCHLFAAGHDIRTAAAYAATMDKFDTVVGRQYLVALHLNDSKAPLGSKRDLHANIGTGYIGLEGFRVLMNDERLHGLPMVLETPIEKDNVKTWAEEIKLLEGLVGVKEGDEDFVRISEELQKNGEAERQRVGAQVEKRYKSEPAKAKGKALVAKAKARAKAKKEDSDSEVEEESETEAPTVKKKAPSVAAKAKAPAKGRGGKSKKEETESEDCEGE